MGELLLVLGGARGGKSRYALDRAASHTGRVLFVATAQAFDDEMRERVRRHQEERPAHWSTLEASRLVAPVLTEHLRLARESGHPYAVILLDCLTLLASNVLLGLPEESTQDEVTAAVLAEVDALLAVREQSDAAWIIVSNEVGMGVIPPTRLGRLYLEALGRANQRVAAAANEVVLMVAGLPWRLKPERTSGG